MTMCIAWTEGLENYYESAVNDQEAIAKSCIEQNGDGSNFISVPEIPNFSCPTLVKVPLGNDWQQLSSAVNHFDANSLGIKIILLTQFPTIRRHWAAAEIQLHSWVCRHLYNRHKAK
ncbi:MAG: hypothetical protein IPH56_01325 [Chitinophagaceae bacterium]|nr:hypothetical protein [Chitinophagaceae bacterium]